MTATTLTNRALRLAKVDAIETLDDKTDVAGYCKENIQLIIDEVLESHDWNFARTRKALLQLSGISFGTWTYFHDAPDDMIQLRALVLPNADHRTNHLIESEYEIFNNNDTADRATGRIASHYEELEMVYTKRIESVPFLPFFFAEACAYLFAFHISNNFSGFERGENALRLYSQLALPRAISRDNAQRRHSIRGSYELLNDSGVGDWDPYGMKR